MIEKMIDSTSELAQWLATREAWDSMADQARAFVLVDAPNQVKGYVKSVNWKMDDPTPKDFVVMFALVYWALKVLYGLFTYARRRLRGETANKEEGELEAFRGPPLGFVGSDKKKALSQSKKRKGRNPNSLVSRTMSTVKVFLFIAGLQCCFGGSGPTGSQLVQLAISSQVRIAAQGLINELLPKITWQREPLFSWVRLVSISYVLYSFFTWIMELPDVLIYQDALAGVLFNTFDIGLELLHLENWLKWPFRFLFVAYWRMGSEHMLAFAFFANILLLRIIRSVIDWLGGRMREPYSIFMRLIVGLPSLFPVVYPIWILFRFSDVKLRGIHKRKHFKLAKTILGIRGTKSLYTILGVPEFADTKVVKKAFRDASRTLHPDKNPDPKAQALFLKMQEAYNQLKGGSIEQMRLQQRESNERDLMAMTDIMRIGMMGVINFFVMGVCTQVSFDLVMYLKKKKGLKERHGAKSSHLQGEWETLLASQATLETYVRSGENRDIQDQATRWLHPLKRAIAFRAKTGFRRTYDEEELKERLSHLKRDLLGIKDKEAAPRDIAPAGAEPPVKNEEEALVGSTKMEIIEKRAIQNICWGLVHRLRHLIDKRVLLTIYLEEVSKQDTAALEGVQKDLDDLITSYTEELNKFAQLEAVDIAIDLDRYVENMDSHKRSIRRNFRKELRKGKEERLQWIKTLLSRPWHEYELHKYGRPTTF